MANTRPLRVEPLEPRELPSGTLVEPFQRGPVNGLPSGWNTWAIGGPGGFAVDATAAGLGDTGRLTSSAATTTASRAWVVAPFAADVETTAAVLLDRTAAVQLFVRGKDLNTATPSYYAAAVRRGGAVQLVKVVGGAMTVLGSVSSAEYVSGKWVQVTVRAEGDRVRATVHRGDTNVYLGPDGKWGRTPVAAVDVTDTAIRTAGQVGFARPAQVAGDVAIDSLRVNPPPPPRANTVAEERFANGAAAGLPSGWSQYTAAAAPVNFRTEADATLRVGGTSTAAARAWLRAETPADVQVSSSVYVDSLVAAGVFARGQRLYVAAASYYSLTVRRGLEVTLSKVIDGTETALVALKSKEWLSGLWVQASLVVKGNELRVQVYRSDTGQYLKPDGTWGLAAGWAATARDSAIASAGPAGLLRGGGYAGELSFDNVIVTAAPGTLTSPGPIPTEQDKPGPAYAPPEDVPVVPPPVPPPPPPPVEPPAPPSTAPVGLPAVPRHYSHIRVANLAYHGTPFGPFEDGLLRNSIDLVVPNLAFVDRIHDVAPATPQFIYTNVSNVYLTLYTDWLAYADKNGRAREGAFFHVTKAMPFTGLSASAVHVNRFWGVHRGNDGSWADATANAQNTAGDVAFAAVGEALAVGYPEKFREVNVDLRTFAANGWAATVEYARTVDANGKPTAWGTLSTRTNTTNGFKQDGQLTFDPPADWVPASVNGSARLYYVRIRTTAGGTAPVAITILGRDYTRSLGRPSGTIPAFDYAADTNGNGYLTDTEYAARKTGFDARFAYEGRMFYPTYGPMRFATNPADAGFRAWAADYHARTLRAVPDATGFFVDNSNGKIALDPATIREAFDDYAVQYGSLLGRVNTSLGAGKWVVANTAGGGKGVEELARNKVSYLEEFGLRPLTANHIQFDDLAAGLAYRRELAGGAQYEILDSLPVGGDPTAARTQLATLAMYYLVADPDKSFLMMNGGYEPASSWTRHWTAAAAYNVGRPTGGHTLFATGADPANRALTYKVYQREYANARMLYKPLSYTRGTTGTTADNTATTHILGGSYRPLRADGTLGAAVTSITLRNGEGAILVKVR